MENGIGDCRPGSGNSDFSHSVMEKPKLPFRSEFFNVFNNVNAESSARRSVYKVAVSIHLGTLRLIDEATFLADRTFPGDVSAIHLAIAACLSTVRFCAASVRQKKANAIHRIAAITVPQKTRRRKGRTPADRFRSLSAKPAHRGTVVARELCRPGCIIAA